MGGGHEEASAAAQPGDDSDSEAAEQTETAPTSRKDVSKLGDSGLISAAEAREERLARRRAAAAERKARRGGLVKRFKWRVAPAGVQFHSEVRAMMYGFGDSNEPSAQSAAALEADALAFAQRAVAHLLRLKGGAKLTLKDFSTYMHDSTHVYFRWKALRQMSGAGAQSDDGGIDDVGAADTLDADEFTTLAEQAEEAEVDASVTKKVKISGVEVDTERWDDADGPIAGGGGAGAGPAMGLGDDDDDAALAADMEASAELELRTGGVHSTPASGATLAWKAFKTRLHFANVRCVVVRCRPAYDASPDIPLPPACAQDVNNELHRV